MGACSSGPSRAGPGRSGSSFVAYSLIALRTGSDPYPHASRASSRSFRSLRISAALASRMASPHIHSKTFARGFQNSVVSNPLISNPYSSFFSFCFSFIYLNLQPPPALESSAQNQLVNSTHPSGGTCPGDGLCNGTGGSSSCSGCPTYNNARNTASRLSSKRNNQCQAHRNRYPRFW
jgi:hypothetical protein